MERKRKNEGRRLHTGGRRIKRRETGEEPVWRSILWGVLLAMLTTAALLTGGASLLYSGLLSGSEGQYRAISILTILLSLAVGTLWVFFNQNGRRRWYALAVAGIYFLLRLFLSGLLLPFGM